MSLARKAFDFYAASDYITQFKGEHVAPVESEDSTMNPSDLESLLQKGEGIMLEYKESLSASFAREVTALANTLGRKILLGVLDDGTVVGIKDTNELRVRIQDIARNCDPPVKVLIEAVGKVLVVTIWESDGKPVQFREGFFWRQGAVTQKLTRDEIRDFFRSEGSIRFDLSLCKSHPLQIGWPSNGNLVS